MTKDMTKDMTKGTPLLLILQFALPLLLGNLLQQTYNIIDAAIVGRFLGTQALASVGATSSVQFLILGFCIGTCGGFGVPFAREFGAGDYSQMRHYIYQAAFLAVGMAGIMTVACTLLCPWILQILSVPEDIYADTYRYIIIIFCGIPFTVLYNFLASLLRSVGDSKTPFLFLAVSTILNIFLDLFCILVLHWGCAGAAIATIASQAVSGILCLRFTIGHFPILRIKTEEKKFFRKDILHLLSMGIPMGIQFSITAIGSMVMQSANNGLGSLYVSGFTAGMRIKQLMICPFDAISSGVSVFLSQNLGAGRSDRIRTGFLQGCVMVTAYALFAGLISILWGRSLSTLFVGKDAAEVLDISARYLRCLGYFYWCLGFLCLGRMGIQGLGFPSYAIVSGVLEMIGRILVTLLFVKSLGFTAICFADQCAWALAALYNMPMCFACIRKVTRGR